MIEEYLADAKALFEKNRLETPFPLETTLIEFKTDELEVDVSHRYVRDTLYSVFGSIYGERLFEDSKMDALNMLFHEKQHAVNKCIFRLLNKEGIYCEASEGGLFLGNGRSVSSVGLWFLYHTNYYDKSDAPTFRALMDEETGAAIQVFECIFAVTQYVIDHHGGTQNLLEMLPEQQPVDFTESRLVRKHINVSATNEMGSLFFSAVEGLEEGEKKVQKACLNSAVEERNKIQKMH